MEHYTMTAAARELGISRQTLYKHVNRDSKLYTADIEGKRVITMYGMELLQNIIRTNAKNIVNADSDISASSVDDDPRIADLQAEVVTLQNTVRGLQEKLSTAEKRCSEAEGYARAMKDAHEKSMETIQTLSARRVSWWARLLPGKQKDAPADQE